VSHVELDYSDRIDHKFDLSENMLADENNPKKVNSKNTYISSANE
jgi:hypothetical protein